MKNKILLFTGVMALLLCFPKVIFGQAPKLGTAANFVLFSSDGAVSNTGISQITGNVGTNNGSSTSFGNVNGVMHDQDSASAQCSKDLLHAYNKLDSTTPTAHPSSSLGGGDTLVAGVYAISGASSLGGTLYLDAKGNANAVFIFQLNGAFSASASSKITLINGAVACNVFWKIEGLVSLASGTTMRGTIIANNAAIKIGTGDTLEGRALSTTGAITVDNALAYIPIGCGSATLTGPKAPDLGTTMCYALFSGDGTVSNTGTSTITGDVGTNVGSTKGFDSSLVKGAIHLIPDSSTKQAAADLTKAYNYLDSLAYDIELLYPAKFGSNLVLTPHTYLLNAATVLTDSVYLNAQGDSNAVFVIQINGALTTSTYASVILINGTQAKNVYWKVKGAVSLNNYSIFRGTIISNAGALSALNTGVVIDGRLLTTAGALTTAAVSIIMTPGCTSIITADSVKITKLTGDQQLCSGGSASFSVTTTGTVLYYQWRKGSVNLSNGGNITGATTAKLTISPVAVADIASNYNVVIKDSLGPYITSNNIALTVNTTPLIITVPVNQSACLGTSASFSVGATGAGLTYQWRIGTANLTNGGNISGANSDVLIIDPVSAADSASNYNVDISGTCQPNNISKYVTLSINTKPVITTSPLSQLTTLGSSVSFSVGATGTGLTYQWKKGTSDLTNSAHISGATTDMLTINPVSASDSATNYNVVISGACAQTTTSTNVSLSISPASSIAPIEGTNNDVASIFPNPFSTSLSFSLNDARQINNCELRIFNSLGKEVMHKAITLQTTSIETGDFQSGVYYYKLINNNQVIQSGKLVSVK